MVRLSRRKSIDVAGELSRILPGKLGGSRVSGVVVAVVAEATSDASSKFVDSVAEIWNGGAGGASVGAGTFEVVSNSGRSATYESSHMSRSRRTRLDAKADIVLGRRPDIGTGYWKREHNAAQASHRGFLESREIKYEEL